MKKFLGLSALIFVGWLALTVTWAAASHLTRVPSPGEASSGSLRITARAIGALEGPGVFGAPTRLAARRLESTARTVERLYGGPERAVASMLDAFGHSHDGSRHYAYRVRHRAPHVKIHVERHRHDELQREIRKRLEERRRELRRRLHRNEGQRQEFRERVLEKQESLRNRLESKFEEARERMSIEGRMHGVTIERDGNEVILRKLNGDVIRLRGGTIEKNGQTIRIDGLDIPEMDVVIPEFDFNFDFDLPDIEALIEESMESLEKRAEDDGRHKRKKRRLIDL